MKRRLNLGSLDNLIGLQLRLAQLHFFELFFEDFGDTGVTPAEYALLALLGENPGVRQGVLGKALQIKRSNMTKVMRSLESRGLVKREAPESDGRAFEVHLTEKGEKIRRTLASHMLECDQTAAAPLTDAEQAQLLSLLKKLTRPHPAVEQLKEEANG